MLGKLKLKAETATL